MYEYYNNDYRSRKKSITLSVKSMIAVCILCGFIGGGMSLVGFNVFNKDVDSGNAFLGATETHDKSQSQNTKNITNISVESVTSYANAVAKKVLPSIVGINVTTKVVNKGWFGDTVTEKVGEGSGIIYKEDGYIITNYHVVQDSIITAGEMNPDSQIKVHLYEDPETGIDARVIGYDIASDLAVIKIEKDNLTAIEIGDSDKVEVGDIVLALGNPGGLKF
ncbi:MAG TPA: S1C family serine protease, partial [Clostridia bacterium]|nr:S1C family serine protease [Clostridia bacterium]